MKFARIAFLLAGLYGLATLLPLYALEDRIAVDSPPAVTHPEFYYGFIGVALAWQLLFLMIARDPVRLRPAMMAGAVEKLLYGAATVCCIFRGGSRRQAWPSGSLTWPWERCSCWPS